MPRREPPVLVHQATKREFMDDVETDAIRADALRMGSKSDRRCREDPVADP